MEGISFVPENILKEEENNFEAAVKAETKKDPSLYTNIEYQPGRHSVGAKEIEAVKIEFRKNWYTTHDWNKEVGERLENTGTRVIAVDGASVASDPEQHNQKLAEDHWITLPTSPGKMNDLGEIYYIEADYAEKDLAVDLPRNVFQGVDEVLDELYIDEIQNSIKKYAVISSVALVASALATAGEYGLEQKQLKTTDKEEESKLMTRREFLKGVAATGVVVATGNAIRPISSIAVNSASARSLTQEDKDFFMDFANVFLEEENTHIVIDGRLALLELSTRDAMSHLDLDYDTKAQLLMGYSHNSGAKNILDDESKIKETATKYIKLLGDTIYAAATKNNFNGKHYRDTVLNTISRVNIYRMSEPQVDENNPDIQELYASHFFEDSFVSPTIKEIIDSL